jgi:putative transposase
MSKNKQRKKSLIPFDQASDRSREIALAKARLLDLVEEFVKTHKDELKATEAVRRCLDHFNRGLIGQEIKGKLRREKVKVRTYYSWRKARDEHGLSGLTEAYNNGGLRIAPDIKKQIESLVWENHLCRYQDIHEDLKVIFQKMPLPSYSAIRRYVKKYKKENWPALVLKHEGQKGLRDRNMQVALGRMDEDLVEPNQKWELDTTIADLFTGRKIKGAVLITKDGKRCKIIGAEDVFSRSLKYYFVKRETGFMVGQVIRDRILTWGLPKEIIIDNGKPYKNNRVLPFLRDLGIAVHTCIPGNPVEKPHIERSFRTLSEKLFRRLPGYSGNSVHTRPNEIKIEYTMAEAQRLVDEYIDNVYAETVHSSTGQRPRERMSPPGFTPKTVAERALHLLLMQEYKRGVHQGHITFQRSKYFHPRLPEGQTVMFRFDDFDASKLYVYKNRKFLCVAEDPVRKGSTPIEIREMGKERNREQRTRIKANEKLLDKPKPKGQRIQDLIEHGKKTKPVELAKKAEVVEFPEVKDIPFSKPGGDHDPAEPGNEIGVAPEERLIRNNQEMYLNVMRKKSKGKGVDEFEQRFLDEYTASNEYRLIGSYLDQQLQTGEAV